MKPYVLRRIIGLGDYGLFRQRKLYVEIWLTTHDGPPIFDRCEKTRGEQNFQI